MSELRDRFPTLARRFEGRRLVYLDTASTALRPREVIEAEAEFYREHNASPHRGLYQLAEEATEAYEGCREAVARWLGAPAAEGVVLTRNATAALNLVAQGLAHRLEEGDEVLLTEMEHHSNLVPWQVVARRRGLVLRFIPFDGEGELELGALPSLIGPRTRVVALTAVSNVLGTINPVAEVAEAARRVGAVVVVDAAQAAGHLPLSFSELGADLLVFSAHKCYGPLGLGFLVGRPGVLEELEPLELGGQMVSEVSLESARYAPVPARFEAGTANAAAAAAFPPAIALLEGEGLGALRARELELTAYLRERLESVGGLELLGPRATERRAGLISFHDPAIHPHDLATLLAGEGVAVRAGHHCAQPLHRKLGLGATLRASLGLYSTPDDVDALAEGLRAARRFMSR